jgi:proteasome assembly chaperone 2
MIESPACVSACTVRLNNPSVRPQRVRMCRIVKQLAVDLLLHNRGARRVGHVVHPALLPMVGAAPVAGAAAEGGAELQLVTAGDVYVVDDDGLLIIQLRSPLSKGGRSAFREAAVAWISSLSPSRVVVLTGVDATERIESQLEGTQMRCGAHPSDQLTRGF